MGDQRRRVLVVDDEPWITRSIVAALQESGLDLDIDVTAGPGDRHTAQPGRRPDLIIVDGSLLADGGGDVLQSVTLAEGPEPVKVLAVQDAAGGTAEACCPHCDDHIDRPLHSSELCAKVATLLELEAALPGHPRHPALEVLQIGPEQPSPAGSMMSFEGGSQRMARIEHVTSLAAGRQRLGLRRFDLVLFHLDRPLDTDLLILNEVLACCDDLPVVVSVEADDVASALASLECGADACVVRSTEGTRAWAQTLHDVVERRRLRSALEQARRYEHFLVTHDRLTGLPNRAHLYDRIDLALRSAEEQQRQVAVLFVALDHFKSINDDFGRAVGDRLLRLVARRLMTGACGAASAARLGSDEFVLLIDRMTDADDGWLAAERVRSTLSQPFVVGAHELTLSASVGIAISPRDGAEAEVLVRHAEAALHEAKSQGRDNCRFFTHDLRLRAGDRRRMARELRCAVERQQLVVHYQPQIDTRSGEIFGTEALVRWEHPQHGLVFPEYFIASAEESGLIGPIVEWVLDAACAQHDAWRRDGRPQIRIAVNLSVSQLRQRGLATKVHATLQRWSVEPHLLELEITESGILHDGRQSLETLHALKALGVRISIDDFGTGQAALSYLRRFPADTIKLDRSYVGHLPDDEVDAAIAAAILTMAHSLHLETIAEGVETLQQLAFLDDCQCHRVQGFLFSRALPARQFEEFWSRSSNERSRTRLRRTHGGFVSRPGAMGPPSAPTATRDADS